MPPYRQAGKPAATGLRGCRWFELNTAVGFGRKRLDNTQKAAFGKRMAVISNSLSEGSSAEHSPARKM
jgi:hypothetical protein